MVITLKKNNNGDVWLDGTKISDYATVLPQKSAERIAFQACLELFPEAKAHNVYKQFARQYISELDTDGAFNQQIDISVFVNRYRGERWQDTKTLLGR